MWSRNSCRRHLAMLGRDKFNIGGVADGAPNDVVGIRVLEPTAVRVVPAKVRVDDVRHGADVALTGYVPGADDQARHIEPPGCVFAKATKMSGLLIAGRHSTYRCLPGFRKRRR